MGCLGCAGRVVAWAENNNHAKDELIWIFEKGDQDQDDLKRRWKIAYPDAAVEPIFLKKRDRYLSSEERRIRPFEAADLIAYENLRAHKQLRDAGSDIYFDELRRPMQRMCNWPGAANWGYFGEPELLSACASWGIPARV